MSKTKLERLRRRTYDYHCKSCGSGTYKPTEAWAERITGNTCEWCGGELGTLEEYAQAEITRRREQVGMPAMEAKLKALEDRLAELENK